MQPTRPQPSLEREGRRLKLSPVCTTCREKHLRCDGAPQCSRCRRNGAECIFVPSRRGMRPSRTLSTKVLSGSLDEAPLPVLSGSSTISSTSSSPSPHHAPQTVATASRQPSSSASSRQLFRLPSAPGVNSIPPISSDQLVESFYSHFAQAQQFIVPKQMLLQKQEDPALYFLRQVIEHIGHSFCSMPSDLRARVPDPTTISQRLPNNGFTVQALLVLALWFESIHQQTQYRRHLHQARDCALAIGMNHIAFAETNSAGSLQLGQSWASTWQVLLRLCQPGSFTADQQLHLPIEGEMATRRMTAPAAPLPIMMEPQNWDWVENYTGQSAYGYQLNMEPAQLSAQSHAQSLPHLYDTSNTIPGHGDSVLDTLPLTTTTFENLPLPVTTAFGSNINPWKP